MISTNPPKTIDTYQQAIRINLEDANAWYNLGFAYKISGQVTEVYKRLKTLDPARAYKFFNKVSMPR